MPLAQYQDQLNTVPLENMLETTEKGVNYGVSALRDMLYCSWAKEAISVWYSLQALLREAFSRGKSVSPFTWAREFTAVFRNVEETFTTPLTGNPLYLLCLRLWPLSPARPSI
jgi:hypothetical protein